MVYGILPWRGRGSTLFDSIRKEMDQLFDRYHPEGEEMTQFFAPRTNLAETEGAYEVTLDLPGMTPEDFQIEFKEGQLWITGERKEEKEEQGKVFHRVERSCGQFRRVITLGHDVDSDKIAASYQNGVLQVSVPKAEAIRPKRIEVKS